MSFTPSQYELALTTRILAKAGLEELRILTTDAALKVFESTKVSHAVLSEILCLADENNDGIIPENGVAIAVRLLGWAQVGERVTKELINKREHACIFASITHHVLLTMLHPQLGLYPQLKALNRWFCTKTPKTHLLYLSCPTSLHRTMPGTWAYFKAATQATAL
jgi:hypothetical protein